MEALSVHPVFVIVAAGTLLCVFARAIAHKIGDFAWFAHTLNGYALLPPNLAQPAAYGLVAAEALVIVGLIVPPTRPVAAMLALVLLLLYASAVAINLARGNRRIDCGCGGAGQGLSWFLVGRNVLLAGLAVLAAAQPLPVELGVFAWISALCGIASFMLLIASAEKLNENWSWLLASNEQHFELHPPHTHEHGEGHS